MHELFSLNLQFHLAANVGFEDEAFNILNTAQSISSNLAEAWTNIWEEIIFNTDSSWWRALIGAAFDIAVLGIVFFAFDAFKKVGQGEQNAEKLFVHTISLVLIMGLLLGNNGLLISNTLGITKGFETKLIKTLGDVQIADVTIANALQNVSLSNTVKQKIDDLLDDCDNFTGDKYASCIKETEAAIQGIVDATDDNPFTQNGVAARYARGILDYIKSIGSNIVKGDVLAAVGTVANATLGTVGFFAITQILLAAIQVAFSMALEIASLLHASALPFVIAFMFTPWRQKFIETWISGLIQIISIKFFYASIIGLAAYALVYSDGQFTTALPFLILVSATGPTMAIMLARGGGAALADNLSRSTIGFTTGTIKAGAQLAAGAATGGGSILGSSITRLISKLRT
jgi:hypothetical protein